MLPTPSTPTIGSLTKTISAAATTTSSRPVVAITTQKSKTTQAPWTPLATQTKKSSKQVASTAATSKGIQTTKAKQTSRAPGLKTGFQTAQSVVSTQPVVSTRPVVSTQQPSTANVTSSSTARQKGSETFTNLPTVKTSSQVSTVTSRATSSRPSESISGKILFYRLSYIVAHSRHPSILTPWLSRRRLSKNLGMTKLGNCLLVYDYVYSN